MTAPYIPFYPSDWLAGVAALTPAEVGVYINVLALVYENDGPVPYDAKRLSRRMGITAGPLKRIIDALIEQGKLTDEEGGIYAPIYDEWKLRSRRDDRRPPIPVLLQNAVYDRDGPICSYCGTGPLESWHIDHIIPWSRGGGHSLENLCVSCASCNLSKGAKTPEEWGALQ